MTLKRILTLIVLILSVGVTFAQWGGSAEKRAFKNMQKGKWQKAHGRLVKTLGKEPVSPAVRYALSVYYFHPDNPDYDLDSAYHYIVHALEDFPVSAARERDKLRRLGVDSLGLIAQRGSIDSTAFEVARQTNTEAAYLEFLSHFPSAVQRDLASQLRDEVAFQEAQKENTYRAFNSYLTRYPASKRAPEALSNYHRLLYFEETKDGRLTSFEKFLATHPETPYRPEVNRRIFEISTAEGTVDSFLSFMRRYPTSDLVQKAKQMAFHILAEEDEPRWPAQFLNDSLRHLLAVNALYIVPYLKDGLYGFIDEKGSEVIAARYKTIDPKYLCGQVMDEVLTLDQQLIARNGSPIFRGPVAELSDIGSGFLKVKTQGDVKVIHKSGFVFADSIQDARVITRTFIALKKNDSWFMHTLSGMQLDVRPWKEVSAFEDVIIFSDSARKFAVRKQLLVKSADAVPLTVSEAFDEIRQWQQGLIWGRSGEYQGVLNQSLERVIGFDKHTLTQTRFGAIAVVANGVTIYNYSGRRSSRFDQIDIMGQRIAVRQNRSWFFFDPVALEPEGRAFDSLRAEGPFVLAQRGDTVYIHFGENIIPFFKPQKISFVPGKDSTSFLIVQERGQEKNVFDMKGTRLFSGSFDAVEYAGSGIFVITRKDRKGLVNSKGKSLVPTEFDAIGSVRDEVLSVLKNKKFGAYHVGTDKLIKPQYQRNLIPYNASTVLTFKDGYYGFLGWDNKPVSAFEFDEVKYWNDTLALVKKGNSWDLYEIHSRKITEGNLKSISFIRDDPDEKIAIVQKDKNFGVISNKGKLIIPITFTAVINLGSAESPLYFTEKHIPEASLYVVIYYDRSGKMLRKEIYDDAGDYDRIYCSDQ